MTEAVEICQYCEGENIFTNYNAKESGYVVKCQHCGEEIMLCDECLHSDDNIEAACDWHEVRKQNGNRLGCCFRGTTHHNTSF